MTARRDLWIGTVVVAVLVAATFLVFVGIPLGGSFELRGEFSSTNQLRPGSPVRLGGVDIGRVDSIERGPQNTSIANLRIDDEAEKIRTDARLAILPRLALEGNAYVDLAPGSPGGPRVRDGATIPLGRTSVAVQLDQVLDVFDAPARIAFKRTVAELATGLGAGRGEGPDKSGAAALRRVTRELHGSLGDVSAVASSLQGTRRGDLGGAVRATGDFAGQLALQPEVLADSVANYNRVVATVADRDRQLRAGLRGLDSLFRSAPSRLAAVDAALPKLTRFADALRPSLRAAPGTLRSGTRAARQLSGLVAPSELPGLLSDLAPASEALPRFATRTRTLAAQLTPLARCISRNVVPTFDEVVPDGPHTTGDPAWQDLLHAAGNLASFSNTFDGNGTALRLGTQLSEAGFTARLPDGTNLYGAGQPVGISPVPLRDPNRMARRPDVPCTENALPDLGARLEQGPPTNIAQAPLPPVTPADRALGAALARRDKSGVLRSLDQLFPKTAERRDDPR